MTHSDTMTEPGANPAAGGHTQRMLSNAAILYAGQLISLVAMTLWTVIIARHVGPEIYGIYSYFGATLGILVIFVNIGLDRLCTRDVAQHPEHGLFYLVSFTLIKTALSLLILGGFLIYARFSGYARGHTDLAVVVTLIWFVGALVTLSSALLYGYQAMRHAVVGQVVNGLLTLLTGAVAVWLQRSFMTVLWLSLAVSCLQLAIVFRYAFVVQRRWTSEHKAPPTQRPDLRRLLAQAVPFAATVLIVVLYRNLIILLLGILTTDTRALGYFAASQRIFDMTYIVPDVLAAAIFPVLASTFQHSREQLPSMFERYYRFLFFVTVPLAAGLWLVAPNILNLIYGPQFSPAAGALRILALALFGAVVYITGSTMEAMNRQVISASIYGVVLALVVVAAYLVIPRYGVEGAAWVLVTGAMIRLVVESVLVFGWMKVKYPLGWVAKTLVASLVMVATGVLFMQWVHFLVFVFLLAPASYLGAHLLLRTVSPNDWALIQDVMPARARRVLALRGSTVES